MNRRVPWMALVWLAALPIAWLGLHLLDGGLHLPPCPFKALTGLPCASCGATRCMVALGRGRFLEALHWHPVLLLLVLLSPLAAAWDLRRALRAEPYPSLPEAPGWRWGAVAAFAGTWALQILRGI